MRRVKPIVKKRKFLTVNDLTRLFGVSRQTIHKWRKDKDLPHIDFPDDGQVIVRFDRGEILTWAREHSISIDRRYL